MFRIAQWVGPVLLLGLFSCGFAGGNEEKAREYTEKADSLRHKRELRKAIELYNKATEADPNYIPAYEGRGLTRLDMNIPDKEVVQDFDKVIELDPERLSAYQHRARAHQSQWNYDGAIQDLEHFLKFKPKDYNTLINLCHDYSRIGKFQKAAERCTQGLKIKTGLAGLNNRGDVYIFLGQFDKALKDFNQALENHSRSWLEASLYFQRGEAYCGLGKTKLCLQDWEKSLKLQPNTILNYHRGIVYYYLKEYEKAGSDFDVLLAENRNRRFTQSFYPAFWMYLVNEKLGRNTPELIEELKSLSYESSWPAPIFSLFEGKITPEELLKKAVDKNSRDATRKKIEAYFYIGQYFLSKGNKTEANKWFQKLLEAEIGMQLKEIKTTRFVLALTK